MYINLKEIGKIPFVLVLRILLICKFLNFTAFFTKTKLSVKVTFKQTIKNNDYWIFLIFVVFALVFFLELEIKEGRTVQRVHLLGCCWTQTDSYWNTCSES